MVLVIGSIYALPNLYPTQPSIQVAYTDSAKSADQSLLDELEEILENEKASYEEIFLRENKIVIKFNDVDTQLSSKTILQNILLDKVIIALFLEPSTPQWLKDIGANPVKLGLDLSGGVHFLLEVDIDTAQQGRLELLLDTYQKTFKEEKIKFDNSSIKDLALYFEFSNKESYNKALKKYRDDSPLVNGLQYIITERPSSNILLLEYSDIALKEIRDYAVGQNLTTLRNRVNELGVSEPIVQRQGSNRIVVELPGVQDPTAAKKIIGKTANLEFRLEANSRTSPLRKEQFDFKENEFQTAYLEKAVIVSGDRVTNASTGFDESGFAQVNITLDMQGGRAMQRATSGNIGRKLGVLFVEQKTNSELVTNAQGESVIEQTTFIEKNIISLATVQAVLGTSFRITGVGSPTEASELALLLRAGALAAPMKFVEERTVGPSLGKENIELGMKSILIGFCLVVLFMALYYRVFGIAANISLIINLVLITGIMSLLGASLTLPGMAGIVLTVGMAVDANVLIFSRIREELKNKDPQSAIRDGFSRAFVTIFDANVTTLIAALILYIIGTGPVKGFAITLSIGIVTSMFTAIMCTRAMVNLIYGNKNIMDIRFRFMKFRKIAGIISISLFIVSIMSLSFRGLSLGLDFSGGTLIEVSYESAVDLESIRNSLEVNGYPDSQVVNFGTNLDVLIKVADQSGNSSIGENIFNILNEQNIPIELKRVEFVGPQVGDELRDQGGLGMIIALFMILIYVAFRFQYKFALGAVTALGHDVVIILGLFSLFGWDFDLTVLAALLAVIGYSLNDTIVVSDRIRENFRTERILEPIDMIDLSLNQTLGRTIVTSLTTLLVLFALFIFGGELIRGFSLALILGVLIGTYSSIYVVANMLMSLTLTQEDLAIPEPEGADFDGMP